MADISPRRRQRIDLAMAAAIGLATMVALLATSRDYAMTWDEGHTLRREEALEIWFAKALSPFPGDREAAFSRKKLEQYWPFAREEPDGHPSFYALLGLAGWKATRSVLTPLTAYRFGPMALAAFTAACVFSSLASRRGRWAGFVASLGVFTVPQVFSLAHYAHYDVPMTCLWVLCQIAFFRGERTHSWGLVFGVLLGLAIGTKFTGFFAIAPPILWVITFEWLPRIRFGPGNGAKADVPPSFRGTRTIAIGAVVAALTLLAILPPWWADPIRGFHRFLASNLTRNRTVPIPTLYMGTIYEFALPWHNTLVLSAISLPLGLIGLATLGGVAGCASRPIDREAVLWVFSWLTLMIVRALPFTPGHDGVRLFLPSVYSLVILAGIGVGYLERWRVGRKWLGLILAACLGEGVVGIVLLYPYTLSYYNAAIGGLKGAERRGFEVTYYWDTLGPEFLRWVREQDQTRGIALRFPSDLINVRYLRRWDEISSRVPIVGIDEPERPDYVLQRRRGVYYPYDAWLEVNGKPKFVIRRQGVDLLRVYPFEESLRAFLATKDLPTPEHLRH